MIHVPQAKDECLLAAYAMTCDLNYRDVRTYALDIARRLGHRSWSDLIIYDTPEKFWHAFGELTQYFTPDFGPESRAGLAPCGPRARSIVCLACSRQGDVWYHAVARDEDGSLWDPDPDGPGRGETVEELTARYAAVGIDVHVAYTLPTPTPTPTRE